MKKIVVFITSIVFSMFSFGMNLQCDTYNTDDNGVVYAADDFSSFNDEVVILVNQEREKNGLAPLKTAKVLDEMATIRSKELVTDFSHTRPDGTRGLDIIKSYNLKYWSAGENIAAGYSTPEDVVQGWMNSSGHRANILNGNYEYIGVGFYHEPSGSYGTYWTQLFYTLDNSLDGEYIPSETVDDTLRGDIDGDGSVAALDALEILYMVVSADNINDTSLYDIDNSGVVDSSDALRLLQFITGIIDKL